MRTRLSVCLRKRSFAASEDALAAADQLSLRPYRCDRCSSFHLTSRTKGKFVGLVWSRLQCSAFAGNEFL